MLRDPFTRTITTAGAVFTAANLPYYFRSVVGGIVGFEVENAGAADLTGFKTQVKMHDAADWIDFVADDGFDPSTTTAVIFAPASPKTLAAGARTSVIIRAQGVCAIQFLAKSATDGVQVNVRGTVDPFN